MTLRDDIVRGVRVGAILLAALLVGYTGYRLMREPAGVPDAPPPKVSAAPVHAPPAKPYPVSKAGGSVPPPPPHGAKDAHRIEQSAVVQTPAADPAPVEERAAAAGDTSVPAAAAEGEKQTSFQTDENSQADSQNGDTVAPPEPRGRRWLKAVGRFLHVGGPKDQTFQTTHQQ